MINVLLDTNLVYSVCGYYKKKSKDQDFNIELLCSDIDKQSYRFVVSNYVVSEIITSNKSDKNKKEILNLLKEKNIKYMYLNKGSIHICDLSKFANLTEERYSQLVDISIKEKVNVESEEIKEDFAIIMFFISTSYGYLLESDFRANNLTGNVIDLTYEVMDKNKQIALTNTKQKIKDLLEKEYARDNIKKGEIKKNVWKLFAVLTKIWIWAYLDYLNTIPELKEFIYLEKEILVSKKDNVFEYFGTLSRRILKISEEDNMIKYISARIKDYLNNLGYPQHFINYNIKLVSNLLKNGHFDKNDAIDSTNFMFTYDDTYLLSKENGIQESIHYLSIDNYNFLQRYKA